ncbi:uncharacterized protein B0I36DRAFT_312810 [Microdochium trichocladiopsis]|uniref:Enoyl reductase (ER) domain-containing protein n=1 Tax=Microdochium trichocladiopsis TaxID=1682393 RepID=A0A9P8YK43_9PEZI|nr:uncharacterized protein B0I36DRAFT_312810 [Microdochium trichocladiopsis]KAH7041422.1 hypothetical protein B0I36DRAFT_312810 [Microdochium trichocladiopsis]
MSTLPTTMKSWVGAGTGPPRGVLHLEVERPMPSVPLTGQIMVKVNYAALNPGDVKVMAMGVPFRSSFVPAMDFVGQVVQMAGDAHKTTVAKIRQGMIVAGTLPMVQSMWRGDGVLAEYVVVPAHAVVQVPDGLHDGPTAAGLLGVAGQTTAVLLRAASLREGQRALVNGASGGVGSVLVQVLSHMGVHVTAICSAKNEDLVRRLGAEEVVDYKAYGSSLYQHLSSIAAKPAGKSFDAVFDLVGDRKLYTSSPSYLDRHGKFLDIEGGPFGMFKFDNWWPVWLGGTPRAFRPVFSYPSGQSAAEVVSWIEKGWIKEIVTDSVYPMEEAVLAYEKLATGRAAGKIYVKVA